MNHRVMGLKEEGGWLIFFSGWTLQNGATAFLVVSLHESTGSDLVVSSF